MRFLSLFAGIGGFDLGLERAGMECAGQVEIEPFAIKVLEKHWPDVKRMTDVRDVEGTEFGAIDLICGGFPCQPFSTASRGRKTEPDNMWREMRRIIKDVRPDYVIVENVQEPVISRADSNLRGINYRTAKFRIGGNETGADHKRDRWWLVAYTDNKSELHSTVYAEMEKLPAVCKGVWGWKNYARAIRVLDGLPNRVDRLKGLGNAVVPQIPEMIGRAILEVES
jgi:DNA (cytosine-5)-methyltransferase 1